MPEVVMARGEGRIRSSALPEVRRACQRSGCELIIDDDGWVVLSPDSHGLRGTMLASVLRHTCGWPIPEADSD